MPTHQPLPDDDAIRMQARAIFRRACEGTDSYHALRLGMARRRALSATGHPAWLRIGAPLAGAAACCALVVGVVWTRPAFHAAPVAITAAASATATAVNTDAEPEVGSNQMEIAQNLDFYRWLAAQPGVATATPGAEH
ncbi:MAG TPA: hypothetical protein VF264_04525 [Rhodanobacteraceae bacterium]